MAKTRKQQKAEAQEKDEGLESRSEDRVDYKDDKDQKSPETATKRKTPPPTPTEEKSEAKIAKTGSESSPRDTLHTKITALLATVPDHPLSALGLLSPDKPTPQTLLAHVFHALLASSPISHSLALRAVEALVKSNYHDLATLKKSTWDERTKVLTDGGYARYREKTATELEALADLISSTYGGDLNRLRNEAEDDPEAIKVKLREIKGIGEVGVGIFFDTAQGLWPCLAPFIDKRNRKEIEKLGLGSTEEIWIAVRRDAGTMARLVAALTKVRLEAKEEEIEEAATAIEHDL